MSRGVQLTAYRQLKHTKERPCRHFITGKKLNAPPVSVSNWGNKGFRSDLMKSWLQLDFRKTFHYNASTVYNQSARLLPAIESHYYSRKSLLTSCANTSPQKFQVTASRPSSKYTKRTWIEQWSDKIFSSPWKSVCSIWKILSCLPESFERRESCCNIPFQQRNESQLPKANSQCFCLGLERLIRVKRAAGRPKDFEVIAELETILEEKNKH